MLREGIVNRAVTIGLRNFKIIQAAKAEPTVFKETIAFYPFEVTPMRLAACAGFVLLVVCSAGSTSAQQANFNQLVANFGGSKKDEPAKQEDPSSTTTEAGK